MPQADSVAAGIWQVCLGHAGRSHVDVRDTLAASSVGDPVSLRLSHFRGVDATTPLRFASTPERYRVDAGPVASALAVIDFAPGALWHLGGGHGVTADRVRETFETAGWRQRERNDAWGGSTFLVVFEQPRPMPHDSARGVVSTPGSAMPAAQLPD